MNSNLSVLWSAWPSIGPYCMHPKQPMDVICFEMPLLSRHRIKELGQNLLTNRTCHSKFLFLWRILTDILVILPMDHGAVTKSPRTTLPKEGKSHWKSKFTALVMRDTVSEFLVSKKVSTGREHTTINTVLLSPAWSMRYSHSAPTSCESIWAAFTSFRNL